MTTGSYEAETKAIRTRFHTAWNATLFPVATGLDTPKNAAGADVVGAWVRLTLVRGTQRQMQVASSAALHRSVNQLILEVFVPTRAASNGGKDPDRVADQAADLFAPIFERVELFTETGTLLRFNAVNGPQPVPLPERAGAAWAKFNITTTYFRDEER